MSRSPAPASIGLLALLLLACGSERGPDYTDPDAVASGLVAAMARADFVAIQGYMSPQCYEMFQRDLVEFQTDLARPETPRGTFVHRIGRERLGKAWPDAIAAARQGSFQDAWRLYIRIQPIPNPPDIRFSRTVAGDPSKRSYLYRRAGTRMQQIDMRQAEGGIWVVEKVAP